MDYLAKEPKKTYMFNQSDEEFRQMFGEAKNRNTEDDDVDMSEVKDEEVIQELDEKIHNEFGYREMQSKRSKVKKGELGYGL